MCRNIGINDDDLLESLEEFEVNLSAENEPSAVVDPSRAVVKITDNDGMYILPEYLLPSLGHTALLLGCSTHITYYSLLKRAFTRS